MRIPATPMAAPREACLVSPSQVAAPLERQMLMPSAAVLGLALATVETAAMPVQWVSPTAQAPVPVPVEMPTAVMAVTQALGLRH